MAKLNKEVRDFLEKNKLDADLVEKYFELYDSGDFYDKFKTLEGAQRFESIIRGLRMEIDDLMKTGENDLDYVESRIQRMDSVANDPELTYTDAEMEANRIDLDAYLENMENGETPLTEINFNSIFNEEMSIQGITIDDAQLVNKIAANTSIYIKDSDYAETFKDMYNELAKNSEKELSLEAKYMMTGNEAFKKLAVQKMQACVSSIKELTEMAKNPEYVYTQDEANEILKSGKTGKELEGVDVDHNPELKVIVDELQDSIDSVAEAKKQAERTMMKAEAAIAEAQPAMDYAEQFNLFAQALGKDEKLAVMTLLFKENFTEESVKKAEEILQGMGKEALGVRDLSVYQKAMEESAFKQAQLEIARHPVDFVLTSMKQAIKEYKEAKQATETADNAFKRGIKATKAMISRVAAAPGKVYAQLATYAAPTPKEFAENAGRIARDAWESMRDIASKTTAFMKSKSKDLVLLCDKGLEAVTLGQWSRFCMAVERKGADYLTRSIGGQTQRDYVSKYTGRFHGVVERAMLGMGFDMNDRITVKASIPFKKLHDGIDQFVEKLAYLAAEAHAHVIEKPMEYGLETDKKNGQEYVAVGEFVKDENGDSMLDMFREGNAYWRDVKSGVWGEGKTSPADRLGDAVKDLKEGLKTYEANRDAGIAAIDKAVASIPSVLANGAKQIIAEGKQFAADVKEDAKNFADQAGKKAKGIFEGIKGAVANGIQNVKDSAAVAKYHFDQEIEGAGVRLKATGLEISADAGEKWASIKSAVLGLQSRVYGELGNLMQKHVNRVAAKVENCEKIEKINYEAEQELNKALWNLVKVTPYQKTDFVTNPYLTQQKEVLMAAAPTLATQFMIHRIDQQIASDRKLWFENECYTEKSYLEARHRLNDQFKGLKEKAIKVADTLGIARTNLVKSKNLTDILMQKRDEKMVEAIEVKREARETAQGKRNVADTMIREDDERDDI